MVGQNDRGKDREAISSVKGAVVVVVVDASQLLGRGEAMWSGGPALGSKWELGPPPHLALPSCFSSKSSMLQTTKRETQQNQSTISPQSSVLVG